MNLTNKEIELLKKLIDDWGFEYGLKTELADIIPLAKKLGMTEWLKTYEPLNNLVTILT